MKRRILSIFMCLCMTLCLLPTAALADSATEYDIWVGGVRVTSENASSVTGPGITGTVSYNAECNTLTLDGASVTGAYTDSIRSAAIYASTSTALTVVLSGVNTVVGTASRYSFGVYCAKALTIEGNGSLNAVGGVEPESTGESIGILGENSVTISGNAMVTATGGKSGAGSIGVFGAHGVNISGATVTATGGEAGGISCGVWGCSANVGVSISGSAKVTATGGTGKSSYGIFGDCYSIDVSGGLVTTTGGKAGNDSWGVYVLGAINVNNSTIEGAVNDGLLIAKSGSATTSSSVNTAPTCGDGSAALTGSENARFAVWGVSDIYPTANIRMSTLDLSPWSDSADSSHWNDTTGGYKTETVEGVKTLTLKNVIINAPDVTDSNAYGIKLYDAAVNIVLEGVNVVSAGDASASPSFGLHGNNDGSISISGDGVLYALAGTAGGGNSTGVCGRNISVSGGATVIAMGGSSTPYTSTGLFGLGLGISVSSGATVTAIAGAGSGSYGVYGNSVTVSGTVTAISGSASYESCGINGGSITVTDGATVTATGGAAAGDSGSYGLRGYDTITLSGTVTAAGGSAVGGSSDSYGVYCDGGSITLSGIVTATGGTAGNNSNGVYGNGIAISGGAVTATGGSAGFTSQGMFSNSNINISGGTVIATGGSAGAASLGIYGYSGLDAVSITGGTVIATGGASMGSNGFSGGIYGNSEICGGISVAGGSVNAVGGAATVSSFGMNGHGGISVSGGSVSATGGTAGTDSFGVYCSNNILSITGGTFTATGKKGGTNNYGVYVSNYNISITGGTFTAIGGITTGSLAISPALDLSSYTADYAVVVSTSADGSGASAWDSSTELTTYKYLKVGLLYPLTVNLDGGSGTTTGSSHMVGDVVSIDAGTKPGYTFSGWTAGGGTFASNSSAATTYTMPASAATITATWTVNSTGGGSSGGSSSSTVTVPVISGSGKVVASVSVSGSTAMVSVTEAQIKEITSSTKSAGTVKVDVSGLKVYAVVFSSKVVAAANSASGFAGLKVTLPAGTVTLDKAALASVAGKGDLKVSLEKADNSKLTETQKEFLGGQANTAVVVDVNVYVGGSKVSTFGDGEISVSVPYTLKSGESADSITVWFMKGDGTIEPKSGVYNAATGCVTFTTEHLSQYLIVDFPFTDIAENAWCYDGVAYAYNNGLFSGTSAKMFSPNAAMTRQMIWMVLARMDGKTPANMAEAKAWTVEKGISDGSNPMGIITREQMATILYRYAQYRGYDVSVGEDTNILSYDDALTISVYAIPAIQWTCGAGLMQGSKNNNIVPFGKATRAQVAAILQRFCQNVAK